MALVRGSANFATHGMIPIIWSRLLIPNQDANAQASMIYNREYEVDIKQGGDIVRINQAPSFNVFTYVPDAAITYQLGTEFYTDLVIDQFLYNAVRVDMIDSAQALFNLNEMYADRLRTAMALAIDKILINKAADGASTQTTFGAPALGQSIALNPDNIEAFYSEIMLRFQELKVSSTTNKPPEALITPAIRNIIVKAAMLSRRNIDLPSFLPSDGADSRKGGPLDFSLDTMNFRVTTNADITPATSTTDAYYKLFAAYSNALTYAVQVQMGETVETFPDFYAKGFRMLTAFGAKVTLPNGVAATFVRTA